MYPTRKGIYTVYCIGIYHSPREGGGVGGVGLSADIILAGENMKNKKKRKKETILMKKEERGHMV